MAALLSGLFCLSIAGVANANSQAGYQTGTGYDGIRADVTGISFNPINSCIVYAMTVGDSQSTNQLLVGELKCDNAAAGDCTGGPVIEQYDNGVYACHHISSYTIGDTKTLALKRNSGTSQCFRAGINGTYNTSWQECEFGLTTSYFSTLAENTRTVNPCAGVWSGKGKWQSVERLTWPSSWDPISDNNPFNFGGGCWTVGPFTGSGANFTVEH